MIAKSFPDLGSDVDIQLHEIHTDSTQLDFQGDTL